MAAKWYLVNFRVKILPLAATIFRSFSGNETSNFNWGDYGWSSGNIHELFLTTMLSAITAITNVCDDVEIERAICMTPLLLLSLLSLFPSLSLEVGPLKSS